MKEILAVLNSSFRLKKITIENFTIPDSELSVAIELVSHEYGDKSIVFEEVSRLNVHSHYYTSSYKSSVIIEDVRDLQWENVSFKVLISEDAMSFYCRSMRLV